VHRDLCGGDIDVPQIAGREFDRDCPDVLVQAMQLGGAWDRDHPRLLRQQPGECDLSRRGLFPFRDTGEQMNQGLIGLEGLRREARQGAAEVGTVELRIFIDLAREEPLAQGAVGDQADSEFLKGRDDFRFRAPPPQRIFALQSRDRLDGVCAADGLHARYLQAEPISRAIARERPTVAAAVPTIWNDVLRYVDANGIDISSLRCVVCGGAAVPRSMQEGFLNRHGVRVVQGWGMTETSPLAAVARPPRGTPRDQEIDWLNKSGRVVAGVELRLMSGEQELPWDGEAVGEIEVRGPWVTGSYYLDDCPEKFHDGWLRTGDVGVVDAKGYIRITDRAKDVIKSGGEWISSVELENHLIAHPDVLEAVVIGVPDERWDERPLACVVMKPGASATLAELRDFLAARVARWWLPERWAFIDEVPKTSVGKLDKKALRSRYAKGEIGEVKVEKPG